MKSLLAVILLILCPSIALSHPGKTDRRGGHKCWKGCAEWGLEYGEYHLHDKDFRPIRLDTTGNSAEIARPVRNSPKVHKPGEGQTTVSVTKVPPEKRPRESAHPQGRKFLSYDEGILSLDAYQLALSAVLIFLLACLLAMRRRSALKRR